MISSKDTLPGPDAKGEVKELKMMGAAGEPATLRKKRSSAEEPAPGRTAVRSTELAR